MTRADAMKKAARLLRKPLTELYYNEAGDAARDEETRLAALEQVRATGILVRQLIEQRSEHVKKILDADPTYQTMTLLIDAEKKYQKEQNAIAQYRCTVGTVDRTIPGFPIGHQEASGANWQTTIDNLEKKIAARNKPKEPTP